MYFIGHIQGLSKGESSRSCSNVGFKRDKSCPDVKRKFHKQDFRTGCLACLHFTADEEGKNWKVTKFIEEHNHPLTLPQDVHLLRSHSHVSDVQATMIQNMSGVGIRTVDAFNLMAVEVGGAHNIGFTKADAYNFIHRERRALVEIGDAARLLEIFK
ncbi:hypothetical protein KSP39_PZI000830 [Platanthera zijinensis]|uniref:FAR1 domain-containing protein n=1 Tax=Platanthera zijinensis TaxID=2320716 RepID=A0AAP0GG89_9ASPA